MSTATPMDATTNPAATEPDTVVFSIQSDTILSQHMTADRLSTWIKVNTKSLFQIVMEKYCAMYRIQQEDVEFLLDSNLIHPWDTPTALKIQQASIIKVRLKPKVSSTYVNSMRTLLCDDRFTDVRLKVAPNHVFPAHKAILCARCPKFRGMFSAHGMKESKEYEVTLETKPDVFASLLEYIYCDSISDLTPQLALDLFPLADEYLLDDLKEICERELLKTISVDNVAALFCAADQYQAKTLRHFCLNFIAVNLNQLVTHPSFKEIQDPMQLHEILSWTSKKIPHHSSSHKRKKDVDV